MYKLVSIDSSTTCTGIAYFEDGQLKRHGIVNLKNDKAVEHRTSEMGLRIMKNLQLLNPDMVVIERPRGRNNPEVLRKLTTLVGMIRGWCVWHNLEYIEVAPTEWRKVLGFHQGRGVKREEEKQQSIDYVLSHYSITAKTDDESDAICIGVAMLQKYGG